jgi:hypothetical protein
VQAQIEVIQGRRDTQTLLREGLDALEIHHVNYAPETIDFIYLRPSPSIEGGYLHMDLAVKFPIRLASTVGVTVYFTF